MDEFFANTATKLKNKQYNELTLVIGNESCDLDSAVSAIVYAMFLDWQYNQLKCKVCTRRYRQETMSYKDDIFVPILNVERQDYDLKTEVAYCFRKQEIDERNLVFRDDYDLTQLTARPNTKVILVDHHVLPARDKFLAKFVTEVIDHRPMDKSSWIYNDDTRSTIEIVGSCSTLVTQRIRELEALLTFEVDFFNTCLGATELLYSTIILDTVNFSKDVNKATPHDEEIILFLESVLKPVDCKSERSRILDTLVIARSDVSALSAAQLLRKDVKITADILVPSFPILVKEFLKRPNSLEAVKDSLQKNKCEMALLLGMDLTQGIQRDTAIYSPENPDRAALLGRHLEDHKNPSLGLSPEVLPDYDCCYYWQLNLSASRKQYIPALNMFLQNK